MWKRSEVEQLTGLGRHVIQDLCNKNTSRDGLGFWEPAVMKPGYSRFDEGDLLAFYLVRQLTKAGFAPAEVEPVVLGLFEEDGALAGALRGKERSLLARRRALEAQLEALGRLSGAAARPARERLGSLMGRSLEASAERALASALDGAVADEEQEVRLRAGLLGFVRAVEHAALGLAEGACDEAAPGTAESELDLAELRGDLARLRDSQAEPAGAEARELVLRVAEALSGDAGDALLAVRALAALLAEAENGIPVELALGKGSFVYLGKAAASCAQELERGQK